MLSREKKVIRNVESYCDWTGSATCSALLERDSLSELSFDPVSMYRNQISVLRVWPLWLSGGTAGYHGMKLPPTPHPPPPPLFFFFFLWARRLKRYHRLTCMESIRGYYIPEEARRKHYFTAILKTGSANRIVTLPKSTKQISKIQLCCVIRVN